MQNLLELKAGDIVYRKYVDHPSIRMVVKISPSGMVFTEWFDKYSETWRHAESEIHQSNLTLVKTPYRRDSKVLTKDGRVYTVSCPPVPEIRQLRLFTLKAKETILPSSILCLYCE